LITSRREVRNEHLVLLGLLLLAFTLRVVSLGDFIPYDREAIQMLTATADAGSPSAFWTTSPAPRNLVYHNLTLPLFQAFGSLPAVGRIVSVAAGTLLVAAALLLRKRSGAVFTISLAALLAFSPIALTLSRTAGSSITAAFGITLAGCAYLGISQIAQEKRAILIGLGLGLALTSGAAGLNGLASLLLVWGFTRFLKFNRISMPQLSIRTIGISAGVTIVMFATGFGLNWAGLASLGSSIGVWWGSWSHAGTTSIAAQLMQLLMFEPLVFTFGLVGVWLAWKARPDPIDRDVSLWAASALLLNLARIGRQPQDLIWIVLPLAWMAAQAVASLISHSHDRPWLQIIVLTGLLLVLAASAGLSVISYLQGFQLSRLGSSVSILYFIFGALVLMAASLMLIFGMEWSWFVALDAVALAAAIVSSSIMLQAAWRLNFSKQDAGVRIVWNSSTVSPGMPLMLATLENASLAVSGFPHEINVQVSGEIPPSMAWGLRQFPRESGEFVPGRGAPAALLTPESQPEVQLLAEYFGQAFELTALPGWEGSLPPEIVRWWVLNEAPADPQRWILWIRADIASLEDQPEEGQP